MYISFYGNFEENDGRKYMYLHEKKDESIKYLQIYFF